MYINHHSSFLAKFFDCFNNLAIGYRHTIIFGDLNANLESLTFDSDQIRLLVATSSLYLVPYATTHHTRSASTLLDLCIIDDEDKLIDHEQRDISFLSAHDLIGITYRVKNRANN